MSCYVLTHLTIPKAFPQAGRRVFFNIISVFALTPESYRRPIYIVELGGGHGKFTFLFLKALERCIESMRHMQRVRVVFVTTDVAASNVEVQALTWTSNPFILSFTLLLLSGRRYGKEQS